MSSIEDLLPPPQPAARPFPWRPLAALFIPAAALAAGTGLQRMVEWPSTDPVLQWLAWSSAAGLLVGALAGFGLRRRLLWAAYGLLAPWLAAGLFTGAVHTLRPLREKLADRREAACRAEGRAICTWQEFAGRCAQAHAEPRRAQELLGAPRSSPCTNQSCTFKWLYSGPFRPEQSTALAQACFVLTDAQGRGIRHWMMPSELPAD